MLATDARSGELGRSQVRDVVPAYLDGHDAKQHDLQDSASRVPEHDKASEPRHDVMEPT